MVAAVAHTCRHALTHHKIIQQFVLPIIEVRFVFNLYNYVISSSRDNMVFHFFATMPFLHFAKLFVRTRQIGFLTRAMLMGRGWVAACHAYGYTGGVPCERTLRNVQIKCSKGSNVQLRKHCRRDDSMDMKISWLPQVFPNLFRHTDRLSRHVLLSVSQGTSHRSR